MAIDEDGGLWIALWNAGAVGHYDALGQRVSTIEVPGISQVSSCTFGGRDRNILFITTSRKGFEPGQELDAGRIFAIQTDTRGAASAEFAG
jgi:sugar lactone lactonase YvrE